MSNQKVTPKNMAQAIYYIRERGGNHHTAALADMLAVDERALRAKLYQNSRRKDGGDVENLGAGWFCRR